MESVIAFTSTTKTSRSLVFCFAKTTCINDGKRPSHRVFSQVHYYHAIRIEAVYDHLFLYALLLLSMRISSHFWSSGISHVWKAASRCFALLIVQYYLLWLQPDQVSPPNWTIFPDTWPKMRIQEAQTGLMLIFFTPSCSSFSVGIQSIVARLVDNRDDLLVTVIEIRESLCSYLQKYTL